MDRREFLYRACQSLLFCAVETPLVAERQGQKGMLGMYVHEHWPYHHPYAARTWTVADWRGYAQGIHLLGYNTVMIWPLIETMPDPPTASDRASLLKHRQAIRMLHREFGMRVLLSLCPNVAAINREADKATWETRHFFYCDRRVNPGDARAMRRMMDHRRKLLEPLKEADGIAIIDSDPGGYPGSDNAQFVGLLEEHRKMLNRLRPGIELLYWMHAGWEAYCRFYETAVFKMGTEAEFEDTLKRLRKLNPEPWGIATPRIKTAERVGLGSRVVALNYGRIESEPSFPLTNFGGDRAYLGGQTEAARGVIGNAQTHCVQLPNTFAFARGAQSKPVDRSDYIGFADRLIVGHGEIITSSWEALSGTDAESMRRMARLLEARSTGNLKTGDLRGLLFGSPRRFLADLLLQLRYKASAEDFFRAVKQQRDIRRALGSFIDSAEAWQLQHGYQDRWRWPELQNATEQLHSQEIDDAWNPKINLKGFAKVRRQYYLTETMTPRLLHAMRNTWTRMKG